MIYTASIFDLDETLVATAPEYRRGVITKTLKALGGQDPLRRLISVMKTAI